ncbi:hypothetical protein [uncultured Methanobrevibacter sp.]|nr:hypothetical protein [uncultured Methanobrevibacter sp.]
MMQIVQMKTAANQNIITTSVLTQNVKIFTVQILIITISSY